MDTESSRQLVLDFYQAWDSGKPADIERVLAEDVEWRPPQSAPIEDVYKGREAVLKALNESGALFFDLPSLKVERQEIVADGDTVVVLQSLTGKALNGRDYSNEYVWVFHCADGKIVRIDEHNDSLRFHQIAIAE